MRAAPAVAGLVGRPERGEPRTEIERDQPAASRRRGWPAAHRSTAWRGSAASSASASKRISRRDPSCATVCGVGGATSSVTRVSAPSGSTRAGDPRHPDVADEDQARRLAQLEARSEDRRERAADEVDRDVPGPAVAHRRGRQRDHPARDGGQRLLRRQDDRLTADGDRQPAGRRFFAHREIEEPRQIVEREHLLAADRARGQRPARVARQHGIWKSRRGRLIGRQSRGQQRQPE